MHVDSTDLSVDGQKISLLVDEPTESSFRGEVVIAPVFGGTARSMFAFSRAFNLNGFRTVRLDFRNHVGNSDGEMADARLSGQVEDVRKVCDAYPDATLLGVSLSARPAIRAVAQGAPVSGITLITPVVNLQATLLEVVGKDYCDTDFALLPESVKVIDYEVNNTFIHDARAHNLVSFESTLSDLVHAQELTLVAGDADPWVSIQDVQQAAAQIARSGTKHGLVEVHAAAHKLNRNPAITMRYVSEAVRDCLEKRGVDGRKALVPTFDDLLNAALARTSHPVLAQVPSND
ncbi:hypothetical protein C5C66_05710 [Rathayibacter toxicus]|uniref:Alpha/beta hydrolase n=1 Tax=Rathayibacter toxicus TaxID=145458 RepID=A0A0C5BEB2_9MICO|nr:hypothetical protein TI83_05895 [Rathayibacter toxicus]ALS56473.1 hypothetical protein APU90_00575 [Rathayibacter toxicus]KKM44579.1 hypothetical protein VT73_08545 [Rathayibacter toxicus]PPG21707.1 hypothetical protein C5D15_05695 [Rathayibacter toxicus]PPG46669.1 hypothetical protein C5D16_05670 [Rathayibacter toxicus]